MFPLREGRMLVLSSKYNIEQADFTDWMSFQPSSLIEESSPIQKPSAQIPKDLNKVIKYEYFNLSN